MLIFFKKKWNEAKKWFNDSSYVSLQPHPSEESNLEDSICSMLCVDDDKSFCFFIQQLAISFGIQMHAVNSIQEAKNAIERNNDYKAFIIDGHLSDGSGFELVAWMREKKGIDLPIVFISRIYQDAASFRLLRENLRVNFVLEKPIQPNEVHQLFIHLCELISFQSSSHESYSKAFLLGLKISYQKTIPDKIERLEKMILNLQRNSDVEHIQTLKKEVHKIAGSAGSYGYMAVTKICKALESDLEKLIELSKIEKLNQAWFESLDEFFTQIKLHFQMKIPEFEFQTNPKTGFLPSLFMVDENREFLKDFSHSVQRLDFECVTESDPDKALDTQAKIDFYPEIILFNARYHSSVLTGYELIKAFYRDNDHLTNVIALMVEKNSFENQAEALLKGMLITIVKPFSPSLLLPVLEEIPFRPLPFPFKVLVVDDDIDICQYIQTYLKHFALDVQILNDVSQLEITLNRGEPDLILLDINLVDGPESKVIHKLRNDWGYKNLLVGMVTLQPEDSHLLQMCYDNNVNDFLFKPLERGVLQRKIALLLKQKAEELLSSKEKELLISASLKTFQTYLNELTKIPQDPLIKMVVVFEIEGLSKTSTKVKDQIVEYVSQAFNNLLRKNEIATYLGVESFALIFQGYEPNFVQLFMRHFLESLQSDLGNNFLTEPFYLHEVLLLIKKGDNSDRILDRAKEILNLARQGIKDPINMITDPSFEGLREVFIFSDNKWEGLDFLRELFKQKGFNVNVNTDLKKLPLFGDQQPLFIFTGAFIEKEGSQLIKKLIQQSQAQIPILHLPEVVGPEYLIRLLNEVNYFEAPFGFIILFSP